MPKRLLVCLSCALLLVGCARQPPVEEALRLVDVHTGWYDAGIVGTDKNKLVPSISLKLENVSDEDVSGVQINAIFRRTGDEQAWGQHFVRAIDRNGLAPGATGGSIVLRSNLGYTGTESRLKMLENSQFVDASVEIFGKSGSRNWVKLGEFPVDRTLLTE